MWKRGRAHVVICRWATRADLPNPRSGGGGSGKDLPVMPGPEKPLLHIAIEFVEMLDNALAEHPKCSTSRTASCRQKLRASTTCPAHRDGRVARSE